MTRAYSYLRFSTPDQMKGDSFRRQREMAETYARTHGYDLDTTLTFDDLGMSAFRGRNNEVGRLADFKEAVERGLVPKGSVLLVEALDRLSRLQPRKALRVLEDIVDAGITVITLNDGRVYDQAALNEDHTSLLVALILFMRANEESATKSRRLKQAWEAKRRKSDQRRLTERAPAWLRPAADSFEPIPERVEVVRQIFDMALRGIGQQRIASALNEQAVPVFGRGSMWHRSYIVKILSNPAVFGQFKPHTLEYDEGGKTQRVMQGVVDGYFPVVIPRETFDAVNDAKNGTFAARGRHAGEPVRSILAGLARCSRCGSTMTRISKGNRAKAGRPYLVCTKAKNGAGCVRKHIPYPVLEAALRDNAEQIVVEAPSPSSTDQIETQLSGLDVVMDQLRERAQGLLELLEEDPKSPTIRATLADVEREMDDVGRQITALADELRASRGPVVQYKLDQLRTALEGDDITAMNQALKGVITRIEVDDFENEMTLHWRHGGETSVTIDLLRYLDDGPRSGLGRGRIASAME